jgi:hypothetical protein
MPRIDIPLLFSISVLFFAFSLSVPLSPAFADCQAQCVDDEVECGMDCAGAYERTGECSGNAGANCECRKRCTRARKNCDIVCHERGGGKGGGKKHKK